MISNTNETMAAKEQHVIAKLGKFLKDKAYEKPRQKYLTGARNVQDLLTGLYGDEINHIEGILPESLEDKQIYTSILSGFYKFAFDTGLSRAIEFQHNGETFHADPVFMLRRSAFLERTRKKLDQMDSKKAAFLMMDVADVGFADMIEDDRHTGIKSADLLLNRFAGTLQQTLDQTQKALDETFGKNTISLMAGRYGGDEFVVSILGNYDNGVIDMVKKNIQERVLVLKNQAVYRKITLQDDHENFRDEKGDIRLKNNSINVTELPTVDQYNQKIFMHYLKQGLIMDQEQINIVRTQYKTENEFDKSVVRRYNFRFEYREDNKILTALEDKIRYILKRHPELRLAFDLASSLDEAETMLGNSGAIIQKRQEAMLQFVQTTLFDPLLGYGVYSYHDFKEHTDDEPIDRFMVFDLKLKEFNEFMGLVFTDGMVGSFWNQIEKAIDDKDKHKVIFGRRGGTFYLAVKKGEKLSSASLKQLSMINKVPFGFIEGRGAERPREIVIPVGTAGIDEPIQDSTKASEETKVNFYQKVIKELDDNPRLVTILQTPQQPHNNRRDYDTMDFYWKYFWGGRFYFRCKDIIQYIPSDRKDLINIFKNIITMKIKS